jgi:hypothetical protein
VADWVARNVSRSRARDLVNASNLRDIHGDVGVLEAYGAEVLALLKSGPGGIESIEFSFDTSFQVKDKWWEPADGYVPVIYEVFDANTGKPIKGAMVRFPSGNAYPTNAAGQARLEMAANSTKNIEVSAPGYVTAQSAISVGERRIEGAIRLAPVSFAQVERPLVTVTVLDVSASTTTPVPNATVTIGRVTRTTDAHGAVSLLLIPGVHSFTVTAKDFVKETGSFDVRTGKDVVLSQMIAIRPNGADDIFVRVRDAKSKKPIVDAGVRISSQQEQTDDHGEARFLKMPFGEHELKFQADGYKLHRLLLKHNRKVAAEFKDVELEPQ